MSLEIYFSMIWEFFMQESVASKKARLRPPTPSLIPPKYRETIIRISVNSYLSIASRIGFPAEPDGSPSSLKRKLFFSIPMRYANGLWAESKYFFLTSEKIFGNSSGLENGNAWAMKLDFWTFNSKKFFDLIVLKESICFSKFDYHPSSHWRGTNLKSLNFWMSSL